MSELIRIPFHGTEVLRKVAAYTEADRELMDAAFALIGATR